MRHKGAIIKACIILVLGLFAFISHELTYLTTHVEAIPAFARKYDFKCNVCHVPGFPKLNDFGNLFRDRGYQLGSDADLPEYEGIGMGFWPVSFRTTVGNQIASLRTGAGNLSTNAVGFTSLDILSFGTLTRDVAHRIVFTGQPSASFGVGGAFGTTPDLESAAIKLMRLEKYLGFKSEPGDYWVNLLIGKHELDVPFSEKRSPTLNTNIVMYHYVPGAVFTSGTLNTGTSGILNGGYLNPNQFGIGDNQPGIELTGIKKTKATGGFFRYTLDAVFTNPSTSSPLGPLNGCVTAAVPGTSGCSGNIGAANGGGGGGYNVNFYGHATQSFGGYGIVTGHRIGVFGMYGHMPTQVNASCQDCLGTAGHYAAFSRIGVDFSTTFNGEWNLFGAFMHGNDSKNLFLAHQLNMNACFTAGVCGPPGGVSPGQAQNASWNGAFVELDYYPTLLPVLGWTDWFFAYRYDVIRNDRQGFSGYASNFNDVDSHTGTIRYFIHQSTRTDVALHLEYNYYRVKGVGSDGSNLVGNTVLTGVDFAF
jgi:hypothetical protein